MPVMKLHEQFPQLPFRNLNCSLVDPQSETDAREIALEFVPAWTVETIVVKRLIGGITNKLYKCSGPAHASVLIRIFGQNTEKFIDRQRELKHMLVFSGTPHSAKVLGLFANGYVYTFIEGRVLHYSELGDSRIVRLIATHLARFHKVGLDESCNPSLWAELETYLSLMPETGATAEQTAQLEAIGKEWIETETKALRNLLDRVPSKVVFAHNDVLANNVIEIPGEEDVRFIDLEYGFRNYRGFDLGNHFCEYAGFHFDWQLYPSKEKMMEFIGVYLSEFLGRNPSPAEAEHLYIEARAFGLASHFFWGTWSLVKSRYALGSTFDYVTYAAGRFDYYKGQKEEFLKSGLLERLGELE